MQVCLSGFVCWRFAMGLQRRKVQIYSSVIPWIPFTECRSRNAADRPSSYNFTFACLAHPQQPNHSAWMRGLRPSSTAKQKTLVVHGCHSVPSIGQRRRFVGVKSGVTIWIFYERQCACIYVHDYCKCCLLFALFDFLFWTRIIMRQWWFSNPGLRDWQLTLLMRRGSGGGKGGRDVEEVDLRVQHQVSHRYPWFLVYFILIFFLGEWPKSKVRCDRFWCVLIFLSQHSLCISFC